MKFIVERTSIWSDDKPCEEAKIMKFEYWHKRTCTEEEFNERFSDREGFWLDKGRNHQTDEYGNIIRQENDQEVWGIEINSLEELLDFRKKYESIVIEPAYECSPDGEPLKIEIYDDYRE